MDDTFSVQGSLRYGQPARWTEQQTLTDEDAHRFNGRFALNEPAHYGILRIDFQPQPHRFSTENCGLL